MVRVSMHDGRLSTDRTAGGRGAWLCPETTCVETAVKRKALPRALRCEVGSEAIEALRAAIVTGSAFSQGARS
ncbi:MAG: YlxR family protein [Microthrixaceae bacterium]|mgnify:CR=1 FL=1|nr:YlxR family protein [Microthrixaceae bacterium]